jgi:hypothetical protein
MPYGRIISVAALALAMAFSAGGGVTAASVSERICEEEQGGTWDKEEKTCTTTETTSPGNNKGKAKWETEETDTAHGNLKNPKSTSDTSCEGPGNSTSKC